MEFDRCSCETGRDKSFPASLLLRLRLKDLLGACRLSSSLASITLLGLLVCFKSTSFAVVDATAAFLIDAAMSLTFIDAAMFDRDFDLWYNGTKARFSFAFSSVFS